MNINRLLGSNNTNNKIIVITAIFSLLFIITAVFFPFEQSQATSAQLQKNNSNYFSLSVLSTVSGTGAAATGIIVTVPEINQNA